MSDPRLPTQQEQVRRLLADARHDEPMPDDVAERLDRVLADLRPAGAAPADPVPDLRAARRRRARRTLVLAAAAAVVVGVGISRVDLAGDPGSSDSSAASESETSSDAGGSAADRDDSEAKRQPAEDQRSLVTEGYRNRAWSQTIAITPASFDRVARRLADSQRLGALNLYAGDAALATRPDALRTTAKTIASCADPAWGRGRRVAARYDGSPAVVVLRPARDGRRVVDLYLCGASLPWRTTTVPAR